jgi:hypothetical protein
MYMATKYSKNFGLPFVICFLKVGRAGLGSWVARWFVFKPKYQFG